MALARPGDEQNLDRNKGDLDNIVWNEVWEPKKTYVLSIRINNIFKWHFFILKSYISVIKITSALVDFFSKIPFFYQYRWLQFFETLVELYCCISEHSQGWEVNFSLSVFGYFDSDIRVYKERYKRATFVSC